MKRPGHLFGDLCGLLLRFVFGDLLDPSGVSSTLEFRVQPDLDHSVHQAISKQVSREAQDIGVVVPSAHASRQVVMAVGRSHSGEFVGDNAHSHSGAADQDSAIGGSVGDGTGDRSGEVGVVDTVGGIGAAVDSLMSEFGQECKHHSLDCKTAVVTGNGDFHVGSVKR